MKTPRFTDSHRFSNGYRRSVQTNIRATFQRVRAAMKANAEERAAKVAPMRKKAAA